MTNEYSFYKNIFYLLDRHSNSLNYHTILKETTLKVCRFHFLSSLVDNRKPDHSGSMIAVNTASFKFSYNTDTHQHLRIIVIQLHSNRRQWKMTAGVSSSHPRSISVNNFALKYGTTTQSIEAGVENATNLLPWIPTENRSCSLDGLWSLQLD